jgi:type I restriction enzyme S subunit
MLNISKIRDYLIVIPPRTDLINFSEMIVSLCQKIENNNSQIQSLSKTRDELLPRLMSGEVRLGHLNSRS